MHSGAEAKTELRNGVTQPGVPAGTEQTDTGLAGVDMPRMDRSQATAGEQDTASAPATARPPVVRQSRECGLRMGKTLIGSVQVGYAADGTPMEVHVTSAIAGIKSTYKIDPTALSAEERANLLAEIRADLSQQGGYHMVTDRLERISVSAEIRRVAKAGAEGSGETFEKLQAGLKSECPKGMQFTLHSAHKQAHAYTLEALQGRHTLGVFSRNGQELELQRGPGDSYFCIMRQGGSEFSYKLLLPADKAGEKLKHLVGIFAEENVVADPASNLIGGKLARLLAFDPDASIAGGKGLHLRGVNLIGRAMKSAEFENCTFENCTAIKARAAQMRCTGCTFVDFRADGANLVGAAFIRCTFKGHTILKGANITRLNWVDSNLEPREEGGVAPSVDARGARAREMESSAVRPRGWIHWLGSKAQSVPLVGGWLAKRLGYTASAEETAQKMTRQLGGMFYTEKCASLHRAPGILEHCSHQVKDSATLRALDEALHIDYSALLGKLRASGVLELQRGGSRIELVERPDGTGFVLKDRKHGVFAAVTCLPDRSDKAQLTIFHTPNKGDPEKSKPRKVNGVLQQVNLGFDSILTGLVHYCNNGSLKIVKREPISARVFKVGKE